MNQFDKAQKLNDQNQDNFIKYVKNLVNQKEKAVFTHFQESLKKKCEKLSDLFCFLTNTIMDYLTEQQLTQLFIFL